MPTFAASGAVDLLNILIFVFPFSKGPWGTINLISALLLQFYLPLL